MTDNELAERITADLRRLCEAGDRNPGTARNRAATAYAAERMRELGLEIEELAFEVPEWRFGTASIHAGGVEFTAHPGPFSEGCHTQGRLLVARSREELEGLDARGAVLLLCDAAAAEPLTPRGYPFYANPAHAAVADALEAAEPVAIVAATTTHQMTGAMTPFPLIEEYGFRIPSAYLAAEQGSRLASHTGEEVGVRIDSQTLPSSGVQPIGRRRCSPEARGATVVVSAHIDSKPETPGALDNAGGVAVLLAVAELLQDAALSHDIEFVPFNGEDHTLAPGEMAYLRARGDHADVRLNVNIDGAGLAGAPSAYSGYSVDGDLAETLERLSASSAGTVVKGPAWPASDHMIFAMRGVPAVAITSSDFETFTRGYSHTPADVPEIVDAELLAATARFVAAVIRSL